MSRRRVDPGVSEAHCGGDSFHYNFLQQTPTKIIILCFYMSNTIALDYIATWSNKYIITLLKLGRVVICLANFAPPANGGNL